MTTTRSHESEQPVSENDISADADFWIRQFIKQLELHFLDASRDLPMDADSSELQLATARAILLTYLESGMDLQSIVELFGRVAVEWPSVGGAWSGALNQRRFALIDRRVEGVLTPGESVELVGLTRMMRDHVESEANLPVEGVRALHRKLLERESKGESD